MASHQSDGSLVVEQKMPVKVTALSEEKPPSSNGVNGHASPREVVTKSIADTPTQTDSIDEPVDATESHTSNNDAFASNQAVAITTSPGEAKSNGASPKVPDAGPEPTTDDAEAKPKASASDVALGEGDDADARQKTEDSVKGEGADLSDEKMDDAPPVVPVETVENGTIKEASEVAKSTDSPAPVDQSFSAATDSQPSPESATQPPSMSNLAIHGTQESAVVPSVDTSMTDSPSQTAKNARERDDDDDEERAAKRPRTQEPEVREEPKVEGEGQNGASEPAQATVADPMDVDDAQAADAVSQPIPSATDLIPVCDKPAAQSPDNLMHPDAENKPMSEHAKIQIKKILMGVKKTKAGVNFRDSVAKLWPQLGDGYSARVANPMDISLMERKLKSNEYKTLLDFKEDVHLLVINSAAFNGPTHDVTASAIAAVTDIWRRMAEFTAEEPAKTSKKEPKQATTTRHAEPRGATQPRPKAPPAATATPPVSRSPAPAQAPPPPASPVEKVAQGAIHAAPPSAASLARRDSARDDDRPKRPIHAPKRDLLDPRAAKKKKLSPELKFCDDVLKDILRPKHAAANWPFLGAVDEARDGAYGYYIAIKKPMDLGKMNDKVQKGDYNNAEEFKSDFQLLLDNCFKFNPPGTEVHDVGRQLEKLFQEKWASFDSVVSKAAARAPARRASASSPGAGIKDESEDDPAPSEPEPEEDTDGVAQLEKEIDGLRNKVQEESQKQIAELASISPDPTVIDISQSIILMLTKSLVEKKKKLEEIKAKKPAPKPKAAAKSKKASASTAAASAPSGPAKKAGGGGGKKAGGGGGKKDKALRLLGAAEKEAIANGINDLEGTHLDSAISIIKKDTNQEENSNGELELDIEQLSNPALHKLLEVMSKGIDGFKKRIDAIHAAEVAAQAPTHAPAAAPGRSQKPKKNKPMGKTEQEQKLEELRLLKAKFHQDGRQNSSSQEPADMQQAAGGAADAAAAHDSESDSEED